MVSTAKENNNVSLLNVVEQIELSHEPDDEENTGIILDFVLISLWARSNFDTPASGQVLFSIESPSGEDVDTIEGRLDLTKFERLRTPVQIQSIPFRGYGRYSFHVKYRDSAEDSWSLVAKVPLKVMLKQDTQEPATDQKQ
jgi:hypothetical protein